MEQALPRWSRGRVALRADSSMSPSSERFVYEPLPREKFLVEERVLAFTEALSEVRTDQPDRPFRRPPCVVCIAMSGNHGLLGQKHAERVSMCT